MNASLQISMRQPISSGRAQLKFRCTRPRSSTSAGARARLGSASSRFRRPAIRRDSSKRQRLPNPGTAGFVNPRSIVAPVVSPTRVERSVPLKAIVSQINYNLFDIELGNQQQQFAYLQAKDLVDTVSGVMVTHDVALVERQRHQPERADDHAVYGRDRADCRRAATRRRSEPRRRSWTA